MCAVAMIAAPLAPVCHVASLPLRTRHLWRSPRSDDRRKKREIDEPRAQAGIRARDLHHPGAPSNPFGEVLPRDVAASATGFMLDTRTTHRRLNKSVDDPSALPHAMEVIDGRYLVHDVIGEGGMAVVLSATHLQLDVLVAIKFLRSELREHPESVERFLREGRAASRIQSEHVARVHDVGVGAYGPYLVMEHLRGRDLEAVVRQDGPLPVDRAVEYVLQACEAMAEAHAAGVIHRDLKPSNIFLATRADGSKCVKVLDFGISKLTTRSDRVAAATVTNPALLMGSPAYMSPEQASSARDVDARTDIWALGATLHELLVGEPPFGDGPSHTLWHRSLTERPVPISLRRPNVPPALDAAIARCLSADRRERYATVAELAGALAECARADGHTSAGRIARISGIPSGGWDVSAAPRAGLVCAKELLESPETRATRGRWSGFVIALALVGVSAAFVAWRYNTALAARTRAAAALVQAREPANGPPASSRAASTPDALEAGAPTHELLPRGEDLDRDAGPDSGPAPSSDAGSRV
jgi:hypothetical protein